MKQLKELFIILSLLTLGTAYAVVAPLSSPQVGLLPANGRVLLTNGTTSTWTSTSSLGISGATYTGTYPIIVSGTVISSGFSTSTVNDFISANTFNATTSVTELRAVGSGGIDIHSNNGTQVALFGAGGSAGVTFYGGVNANSTLDITGKTTFSNASGTGLTSTNLYSTNYYPGFTNSFVSVDINGKLVSTSTPIFLSSLSATYPVIYNNSTGVISSGFSTSTTNNYTGVNTFTAQTNLANASATGISTTNLFATGTTILATTTINGSTTIANTLNVTKTVTLATTTINGDLSLNGTFIPRVVGYASAASTTINIDTTDIATTTITATTTFVNPTGVVVDGRMFEIRAKATTTRGIFWGTNFASSTDLNNVSQIASGTTRWLFEYRQDVGKWDLVGLLKNYIN